MVGTRRDVATPLLGRAQEQALLTSLLDGVAERGQALVLRGEPGIGKSRLLSVAAGAARDRGMTVLTTSGVQSEAHLPFAGLHQLLRPVRERVVELPAVQRAALDAAFGLEHDVAPEPYRIAMASLDLVSEVAADAPLLLVVEDAHWLDLPTADVLAFVARRIESDPVLLLAAVRDGYPSALADAGLPEHRLAGLEDATATALLDASAAHLSPTTRNRVLREAAGNPLALLELPAAAGRPEDALPGGLPLSERLERAFADRVSDLPGDTRVVLLVAALSEEDAIDEILRAAGAVAGTGLDLGAAEPAAEAGIADVDLHTFRFRHPLIRSAVAQSAGLADRRRVHEALADVLEDRDRRAWHRAALISGTHEDVAVELEEAGRRARRRGATAVAVTATRRAAELGETAQRGRRLLAAAELAFEAGQPDVVVGLLREIEPLRPSAPERARLAWIEEMVDPKPLDEQRVTALLAIAEAGDDADLLWLVVSRAWYADPSPATRRILVEAVRRLSPPADDGRGLAIRLAADPLNPPAALSARLRRVAAEGGYTTDAALHLGPAAAVVGEFESAGVFLAGAVDGLRDEGRLGLLPRMLSLQATVAAFLADWATARPAAEELRRLASELNEPLYAAGGDFAASLIAGMRGDEDAAEAGAARAEEFGLPARVNAIVAQAQFGRVAAALGAGRPIEAYEFAERLFDPLDPAHHPMLARWVIGDLAEAALQAGRVAQGRKRLAQIETAVGAHPAPWIALNLRHACAVLAEDDAASRFEAALGADLTRWPYHRARLLLAYGRWLRRRREITESRAALRAARDAFDALGCTSWSSQTRRELRASGERSRRREPEARDQLTAQELQIAQLAAEGLSNREIGRRLYLSHRTVSTHLYRVFPKLGITSRGELGGALTPVPLAPDAADDGR
ncbi:ATP-binding protein [Candidatus Solirubrobacter pratensis]|uniref:ATP-binding protein n=1 Tax=Candidatus Solirubrobacter pratensis TaxID=1298857 RepID=UPI000425468B|nr:LuxR family transcriptional regulator [Candidatus Solirubrobacter pratensis]